MLIVVQKEASFDCGLGFGLEIESLAFPFPLDFTRFLKLGTKYQVIFQCAIFLLLHMLCVILGAYLFLFCSL